MLLCLKSPDRQWRNMSCEDFYGNVPKQACPNGDPTGLFGHIVVVCHGMRWTALIEWLVRSSFSEKDSREIGSLWWYTQFLLWSMAAVWQQYMPALAPKILASTCQFMTQQQCPSLATVMACLEDDDMADKCTLRRLLEPAARITQQISFKH